MKPLYDLKKELFTVGYVYIYVISSKDRDYYLAYSNKINEAYLGVISGNSGHDADWYSLYTNSTSIKDDMNSYYKNLVLEKYKKYLSIL